MNTTKLLPLYATDLLSKVFTHSTKLLDPHNTYILINAASGQPKWKLFKHNH